MRLIDVWWTGRNIREQQGVNFIRDGKKLMQQKLNDGCSEIVMYAAHHKNDDDTIVYFFKDGKIKSEKL
jgi:hypothetical protein